MHYGKVAADAKNRVRTGRGFFCRWIGNNKQNKQNNEGVGTLRGLIIAEGGGTGMVRGGGSRWCRRWRGRFEGGRKFGGDGEESLILEI